MSELFKTPESLEEDLDEDFDVSDSKHAPKAKKFVVVFEQVETLSK